MRFIPGQVVPLCKQGVFPAYVSSLDLHLGFALCKQGVFPDYVSSLKLLHFFGLEWAGEVLGFSLDLPPERYVRMKRKQFRLNPPPPRQEAGSV